MIARGNEPHSSELRRFRASPLPLFPRFSRAADFTADVYQLGDLKKVLFQLELAEQGKPERMTIKARFTDTEGKPVVLEESVVESGALKFYKQDHLQLGESGTVEVRDGKVHFQYTRDGKTKTDQEKATDNLIASPNTMDYIRKSWPRLMAGETVDVRFAVPDRLETVGFKFFKTGETAKEGRTIVTIRMKPSSFVIAALIDPLDFQIDKESIRLVDLKGRTIPKLRIGNKWKDLDAHIFYKYKS